MASNTTTTTSGKSVPIYSASSSHEHSHSCNDPSHHHHPIHSSFYEQSDLLAKRKAKKNTKQDVTRAELIPGHRGDSNIDDLVKFINGPATANSSTTTGSKKSKKKSPARSN